jgi:predicted peroxiredoxin
MPQTTIDDTEFDPSIGIPVNIKTYPGSFTTRSLPSKVLLDKKKPKQYGPTECWDRFIAAQPAWIRQLLQEVHFYTDDGHQNIDEILLLHDKVGHLLSVSDGSVKFHNMSFGWIIATPDGRRLAAGCGPCEGRGNSLRSEGAVMLAATLFMALISHHMNHKVKVICISDNKELIRRKIEHKNYEEPYPNATLASEYNIIEEIYETCKIYNIKSSYHWVQGHQDKHTSYDDLSLEAQLNVDADWYAGKYYEESGNFLPQCTLLPACPAMLSIRDITVTSDYKNQLIRAYTKPRYIEYLQNKFGWSDTVINLIAWKSLSLAVRRINRSVILTKISYDLLPTAETLKKYKYQNSDKCVLCDKTETRDHMIQCKA